MVDACAGSGLSTHAVFEPPENVSYTVAVTLLASMSPRSAASGLATASRADAWSSASTASASGPA